MVAMSRESSVRVLLVVAVLLVLVLLLALLVVSGLLVRRGRGRTSSTVLVGDVLLPQSLSQLGVLFGQRMLMVSKMKLAVHIGRDAKGKGQEQIADNVIVKVDKTAVAADMSDQPAPAKR